MTSARPDLAEVKGQRLAKRALEIAAAGGHNILFVGPPGAGKEHAGPPASRHPAADERKRSLGGRRRRFDTRPRHRSAATGACAPSGRRITPRPRPRSSAAARTPVPGEISRAHNGVLFLDELPEFNRRVLESLREPMEAGRIAISRAGCQAEFPARFQLVAAMNPCPCGYLGDPRGDCGCSAERVRSYRGKISGPLLDRIDIHLSVQRPPKESLRPDAPPAERSRSVATRVRRARSIQIRRAGRCNAHLEGDALVEHCALSPRGINTLGTGDGSLRHVCEERIRKS